MTKYRFEGQDFPDFEALRPVLADFLEVDELPVVAIHSTGVDGEAPGAGGIYFMPKGGWTAQNEPTFTYERVDGVRVVTPV